MELRHVQSAKAEMLIRKPVEEVFEAFVNPAVTTKFWFTKSRGTNKGPRLQISNLKNVGPTFMFIP
jgi:uncharacterized protein YndB with AHSA1/START domain